MSGWHSTRLGARIIGAMASARDGQLAGPTAPLSSDAWIDAVIDRHTRGLTTPEFLKAVRALSVRYVERRADLQSRSPIDSPGKRAAFAGFFALLHYLTVGDILRAIAPPVAPATLLDLGCGTGVAAAAWVHAAAQPSPSPIVTGVDQSGWALDEARWNWQVLGLQSRTKRVSAMSVLLPQPRQKAAVTRPNGAIVLAWSANELSDHERSQLLPTLIDAHGRGTQVLVIEPLARTAAPWWNRWSEPVHASGGRVDEWKFPPRLPPRLAALDEAAGFRREYLSARSLWLPGT